MLYFRLIVLVDGNTTAIIGFDPCRGQIKIVNRALASNRVKECVAGDFLLAFQIGYDGSIGEFLDALHFFAQTHGDAAVAEVIAERLDNLLICKFEKLGAFFNQGDRARPA